jgi:uncharacterized protein YpmS
MVFQQVDYSMNLWKVFALIMISLLIIAVGLKFKYAEAHTFPINESQKLFAKNAAQIGFRDEMGSNNYNVTVQDYGRTISTANGDKKVVRVILTQGNITLTALVDMESGNVVEKSMVERSGWMIEYIIHKNQNTKIWGYQRLFDR